MHVIFDESYKKTKTLHFVPLWLYPSSHLVVDIENAPMKPLLGHILLGKQTGNRTVYILSYTVIVNKQ